ncbi:MAG: NAD(+)/NADH kinase [Spirochaetes bacterium]|nr:NAD(+)/NADH kinase [Spirochaetota bacterium]
MKRAVLFVSVHKKNSKEAALQIQRELASRDVAVTVFPFADSSDKPPQGNWDIALSLGGDGTVLFAARSLAGAGTPIIPINLGTLGFIANVKADNWLAVFEKWERGEADYSPRCMLEVAVERKKQTISKNICLNDAVVSATGIAKLIKLKVHTSLAPNDCTDLGFYRCDGFIVSTPTGSTAYSLAAGGPILDPEMEATILNPICPFTLSSRPLVLPSNLALTITVAEDQRSGVLLTVDGQDAYALESDDKITIQQAGCYAKLISANRSAYYAALRTKLSWAGTPVVADNEGGNHA